MIAAAVGAACILVQPVLTAVLVGAFVIAWLFLFRPKVAVGATVLTIMFGTSVETATGLAVIGWADELLIGAAVVFCVGMRWLRGDPLRSLPGAKWLLVYVLFGLLSCLARDAPLDIGLKSLLLTIKGFIFAFAVAQLNWTSRDVKRMVKPAACVMIFVLIASAVNLVMPGLWTAFLGRASAGVSYRLGFPSLIGPFDHPFAYGQFMALAIAALVAYRANVRKSPGSSVLLVGAMLGVLLSFRRKAIVAAAAAALSARSFTPGKRLSTSLSMFVVLPLALLVGWDSLSSVVQFTYNEYFLNPTETARTLMYRDSLALSLAYFPLGAGFGRFGSFTASQEYSPEYVNLGYPFIYRMGPGDKGGFLSDTFWPAILGEAGIFGLIAFCLALFFLAKTGHSLIRTTSDPYVRWIGVVSVAWFIEFAIESVAAPSFNSPPLFALLFASAGIAASLLAAERGASQRSSTVTSYKRLTS